MSDWIDVGDPTGKTWDKSEPIQGIFTNMKTGVGRNKSNLYTLKTADGEVGVWGSTVIDSKFEQIPEGAEVRIEYLGTAESKSGNEYADFKVQYRETPMVEVKANEATAKDIFGE